MKTKPQERSHLILLADAARRRNDYAQAEILYSDWTNRHPDDGEVRFALAEIYHQTGRPQFAAEQLQLAMPYHPDPAMVCYCLSQLYSGSGYHAQALEALKRSVELQPTSHELQASLAVDLASYGEIDLSIACYQQAYRSNPLNPAVCNNLGELLAKVGKVEEAIVVLREASSLAPHQPEVQLNLGVALRKAGRPSEAEISYRHAIDLQPADVEAWNNLGNVLIDLGRLKEAVGCYQKALEYKPANVITHHHLGGVFFKMGQFESAAEHYVTALKLSPDFADAMTGLAALRHKQGQMKDAAELLEKSLLLNPEQQDARTILAAIELNKGELDQAAERLHTAIQLKPNNPESHSILGFVTLEQGNVEQAVEHFRRAISLDPTDPCRGSNLAFALGHSATITSDELHAENLLIGQAFGQYANSTHSSPNAPGRKIRIGYVSPDFRKHIVMRFFEPIVRHHDKSAYELFAYAEVAAPDDVTHRVRQYFDTWRSTCGLHDAEIADQICHDGIDILVDLAGHTSHHCLGAFARKPAPIQISYLGYPYTTAIRGIAYRLTDTVCDPLDSNPNFTEQLIRLPGSFFCFEPPDDAPAVSSLPAATNGHITFGSLHRLSKLNDRVLDLWATLLNAMPSARLVVIRHTLKGSTKQRLHDALTSRGIAEHRFDLRCEWSRQDGHLSLYSEIDVLLDTFPWSGHATACDAAWMGVPTLTLLGDRHAARMVSSLMTQMQLNDFIATDSSEFVRLGVSLESRLSYLAEVRSSLRNQMTKKLSDGAEFTRNLESAYLRLWQACAGKNSHHGYL